ncbi:hypothetical protein HY496_00435 [Candidatus Woesearchaeota archaeon]|nr:hypothetical protein [Candidatus Woesearchaeota archaeon]
MKWKPGEVIDIENHYPKGNALFHLNKSKVRSPLIVIDPVDKNRNAAAALSKEKWALFQKNAAAYLKKPSSAFFEKKIVTVDGWKKNVRTAGEHGVWIDLLLLPGKEDVVGVKLVKALDYVVKELSPFTVLSSGWTWDKSTQASLHIEVKTDHRPQEEIKMGPPLALTSFVTDFKKKNKNTYVEKGRIVAKIKISKTLLHEVIASILKKEYIQEKIQSVQGITVV